jgi:F0F1-type ATP synthase assembly protein I
MPPHPQDQSQGDAPETGGAKAGSEKARGEDDASLAGWYRMAGAGIEFVVAVGLFAGLGYLADRWLKTSPWLILLGAGLGFAVGLRAMIKMAMRSFRE